MRLSVLALILGMAFVTFLPRFFPMALLTQRRTPHRVRRVLDHLPVSILSAIVCPILFSDSNGNLWVQPHVLLAAVPVFVFAWRVKSIWGSVVIGMLVFWGVQCILH